MSIECFIEAGLEEAFGVSFGPESSRVLPKLQYYASGSTVESRSSACRVTMSVASLQECVALCQKRKTTLDQMKMKSPDKERVP